MCLSKDPVGETEWKYTFHLDPWLILVSLDIFMPTEKNKERNPPGRSARESKKEIRRKNHISSEEPGHVLVVYRQILQAFTSATLDSLFAYFLLTLLVFSLINTFNLSYTNILLFAALEPVLPSLPCKSFCFVQVWLTVSYKIPSFM